MVMNIVNLMYSIHINNNLNAHDNNEDEDIIPIVEY
jgi:hypothetical protein